MVPEKKSELSVTWITLILIYVSPILEGLCKKYLGLDVSFSAAATLLLGGSAVYTGARTYKKIQDGKTNGNGSTTVTPQAPAGDTAIIR
jgi:hypothetical protein